MVGKLFLKKCGTIFSNLEMVGLKNRESVKIRGPKLHLSQIIKLPGLHLEYS
jgi:hypothetical protein